MFFGFANFCLVLSVNLIKFGWIYAYVLFYLLQYCKCVLFQGYLVILLENKMKIQISNAYLLNCFVGESECESSIFQPCVTAGGFGGLRVN